jgi:hypothetical protein
MPSFFLNAKVLVFFACFLQKKEVAPIFFQTKTFATGRPFFVVVFLTDILKANNT